MVTLSNRNREMKIGNGGDDIGGAGE